MRRKELESESRISQQLQKRRKLSVSDPYSIDWDIRRKGRHCRDEAMDRYWLKPEKIEMADGKLYNNNDRERLMMIGLLLENVGINKVVRLGDPQVWRDAIAALPK
jgi:hypothetical protein